MSPHNASRIAGLVSVALLVAPPWAEDVVAGGKVTSPTRRDGGSHHQGGSRVTSAMIADFAVEGGEKSDPELAPSIGVLDAGGEVVGRARRGGTIGAGGGTIGCSASREVGHPAAGKHSITATLTDLAVGATSAQEPEANDRSPTRSAGESLTPQEAEELVRFHNEVRKDVGVGPVKWSPALAKFAQGWADEVARTGDVKHRPQEGEFAQKYGENIAWGRGGGYTVKAAAESWYEEKKHYTERH